ncbi:MAG TPA: TadE/TadG family type IV pilus assembly protein [Bacillales bacterium]|nr:TadE/TadG family type IV pilus assembly protein [Bacillales bacterium]
MKRLFRDQQGSTLILFALAFIGMMAMAGLVLDGGMLYVEKAALQKTADAAVLSGAQELTDSQDEVQQVVNHILAAHGKSNTLVDLNVVMNDKVSVSLKETVPLSFFSIFGQDTGTVTAQSTAEIGPMGRATGAAPLGIDASVDLVYNKEYQLKVDQTLEDTGNFGVLALGGEGASNYYDNLRNGYDGELKVGDIVQTETGNISGKTRQAVQELIEACPYPDGDYDHRDCPRVILIPVYEPYNDTQNQIKEVKITGFAYFYISEPVDSQDKTVQGIFIKRTGKGYVNSEALNRGAYAIRLTE